jgi:deoxyribose-phosphate aldolase
MDRLGVARRALSLLDLTNLDDDCTEAAIDVLLGNSQGPWGHVAAVCVWPDFVAKCHHALKGTDVRVATVVNFPSGRDRAHAVGVLTERALSDGADEIDVVLPHEAFAAGHHRRVTDVLDAVHAAAGSASASRARPALMKVILETGALHDTEIIRRAAELAVAHGADFVKTSTGKIPVSATPAAAEVMLEVIHGADRPVGIKPSGGIRTIDDAAVYLDIADRVMGTGWAAPGTFRFGASGLRDALLAELDGSAHTEHEGY